MKMNWVRSLEKTKVKRKVFHIIRFCDKKGREKAIARRRDPRGKLREGQRYGGTFLADNKKQAEFLLNYNIKMAIQKGWPLNIKTNDKRKD